MKLLSTVALLSTLLPVGEAVAATLPVPGLHATLQAALDAAAPGDTVLVADGTYTGAGNRDLDFGGKAVVLRSERGPSAAIIDCRATAADRHRAIRLHSGEGAGTVIEGFTITGGFAPADGPFGESFGGGILVDSGAAARITNCVFLANAARHLGGGLAVAHNSAPEVSGCRFELNACLHHPSTTGGGWGGGAGIWGATASFADCAFEDNEANLGGGASVDQSVVTFDRCTFTRNRAPDFGAFQPPSPGNGGGLLLTESSAAIAYCVFDRNVAMANAVIQGWGGGIALFFSSARLENCTLHGNVAEGIGIHPGWGGGIYCSYSSPILERCIISQSGDAEAIFCIDVQSAPQLSCSDLYENDEGNWTGPIAAQEFSAGNFSLDPGYCIAAIGELTLRDGSPCLPTGNTCGARVGALGLGCITTDVPDDGDRPSHFALYPNFPNPFNAGTTIRFSAGARLGGSARTTLVVSDILGRRVRTLLDGRLDAGDHKVEWDGRDEQGRPVASGVYFFVLDAPERRFVQKALLLK